MTNIFAMTTRNVCVNKQTGFFFLQASFTIKGSGFRTKVRVVAAPKVCEAKNLCLCSRFVFVQQFLLELRRERARASFNEPAGI